MAQSSDRTFFGHALRAMLHPLSITFAIGTVVVGALSATFAVPLAIAWLATVGVLARKRAREARTPDISRLPPSIQADLIDVTAALDQLQEAARSVPEEQRPMFEGIEREAEEVREAVLELGLKAGTLHRHIEQMRQDQIEAELQARRARLEATEDESARREIESSIAELEGRIERREQLMSRLDRYRATIRSLESTAGELADRAVDLAAGAPLEYDSLDQGSPERKISEMKASVAALEEVMGTDTETL